MSVFFVFVAFFFFKQKTAYEMRISDWSSDVCSSDLYTTPVEEALSRLLSNPRFCEFEMAGLLQGTPAEEIDLLLQQVAAGLLTVDEARAIRNLPDRKSVV